MRIVLAILIALVVGCKAKELTPLDEGYPVTSTGERIKLYDTQKFGGTFDIKFNGHTWNHYPYLMFNVYKEFREDYGKDSVMYIQFLMLKDNNFLVPKICVKEIVAFYAPLKRGVFNFPIPEIPITSVPDANSYFMGYDCDYLTQGFRLDETQSWVEITEYNAKKSIIAGKFHFYLNNVPQPVKEGPTYPDWVELEGTFSRDYFGTAKL